MNMEGGFLLVTGDSDKAGALVVAVALDYLIVFGQDGNVANPALMVCIAPEPAIGAQTLGLSAETQSRAAGTGSHELPPIHCLVVHGLWLLL